MFLGTGSPSVDRSPVLGFLLPTRRQVKKADWREKFTAFQAVGTNAVGTCLVDPCDWSDCRVVRHWIHIPFDRVWRHFCVALEGPSHYVYSVLQGFDLLCSGSSEVLFVTLRMKINKTTLAVVHQILSIIYGWTELYHVRFLQIPYPLQSNVDLGPSIKYEPSMISLAHQLLHIFLQEPIFGISPHEEIDHFSRLIGVCFHYLGPRPSDVLVGLVILSRHYQEGI